MDKIKNEKELLKSTLTFLKDLGVKIKDLSEEDGNKFLRRYSIGSRESLKRFWEYKKKQLEGLNNESDS